MALGLAELVHGVPAVVLGTSVAERRGVLVVAIATDAPVLVDA